MVNQRTLNIHVKNQRNKEKIANKKIKEAFTLKNTTIYGGYNLYSDHVAQSGLDRVLADELSGMKAPWATYRMPLVCRTLIDGYALGLENIYQFEGIERDPLITSKHALEKLPDQTVLRKDLINQFKTDDDVNRLRQMKAKQVKNVLMHVDGSLVLEYDSTVETGYGSQEGFTVGYNPHSRGRASYHPQLCRERKTGLSVWSRLRPGNTVSSTDFIDFPEESWRLIPKRFKRKGRNGLYRVVKRMESGYEYEEVLKLLEGHRVGYVIKMTMRGDIWSKVFAIAKSKYRTIDTEVGKVHVVSLQFKRASWSQSRRVVVIRWEKETNRAQTNPFDALNYAYSVFVTGFPWDEEDIYRFYDKRADVENHIREAAA